MLVLLGIILLTLSWLCENNIILLVCQLLGIYISLANIKTLISFHSLFTLSYVIVNWQIFWGIQFLSIPLPDFMCEWFLSSQSAFWKALHVSTLGIYVYLIAYSNHKVRKNNPRKLPTRFSSTGVRNILLLTLIAFGFYLAVGDSYRNHTYGYGTASAIENYVRYVFINLLYGVILINAYSLRFGNKVLTVRDLLRRTPNILKIIVLAHSYFLVMQGDRGNLLTIWVLFLAPVIFQRFRLSWLKSGLLAFTGVFFANLMSAYRSSSGSSFSSFRIDQFFDRVDNLYGSFFELALSGRILNHAIASTENSGHFYGWFHMKHLIASLPGLAGTVNKLFSIPPFLDSSADYMSYVIQNGHVLYGDGTSVLTDFYLDFGLFGIVFGMYIVGICGRRVDELFINETLIIGIYEWVFLVFFYSVALYLPRGSFGILLQTTLPVAFLCSMIIKRC